MFNQIRSRLVRIRSGALAVLCVAAVLGLGTRCIDRTSVHTDKDGYTHITGEMVNDTQVQGTKIMLRGTLYDAQNNVLATKDAPTCPPDTQPNNQTIFDIRFDNPNISPFDHFDVRPISGTALTAPLTDPNVVTLETTADRFTNLPPIPGLDLTANDVLFSFTVRNRSPQFYNGVQGCAAVYDNTGAVIFVISTDFFSRDANGHQIPAVFDNIGPDSVFMIAKDVPPGPTQVRAWIWLGQKGDPTSAYQFISTPLITIQTH